MASLTGTKSDEVYGVGVLTRLIAQTTPKYDAGDVVHKLSAMEGSLQSTTVFSAGSWSGQNLYSSSSRGTAQGTEQLSPPPSTSLNWKEDSWGALDALADQMERMNVKENVSILCHGRGGFRPSEKPPGLSKPGLPLKSIHPPGFPVTHRNDTNQDALGMQIQMLKQRLPQQRNWGPPAMTSEAQHVQRSIRSVAGINYTVGDQLDRMNIEENVSICHERDGVRPPDKPLAVGLSKPGAPLKTIDPSRFPATQRNTSNQEALAMQVLTQRQPQQRIRGIPTKTSEAPQERRSITSVADANNYGRPAIIRPPSACPPVPKNFTSTGMTVALLPKSSSTQRKSTGTGVFLPRGGGKASNIKTNTDCLTAWIPAKVVRALNPNIHCVSGVPQPCHYSCNHNKFDPPRDQTMFAAAGNDFHHDQRWRPI